MILLLEDLLLAITGILLFILIVGKRRLDVPGVRMPGFMEVIL